MLFNTLFQIRKRPELDWQNYSGSTRSASSHDAVLTSCERECRDIEKRFSSQYPKLQAQVSVSSQPLKT